MKTVVFLQNAWSTKYAGKEWPRSLWLRALKRSRSGVRLSIFVEDFSLCFNVTPKVAQNASGFIAHDERYVKKILGAHRPDLVVACGKSAEKALTECWNGPLLVVPHPASRTLTNELYETTARLIRDKFSSRSALRQGRGFFTIVPLPKPTGRESQS